MASSALLGARIAGASRVAGTATLGKPAATPLAAPLPQGIAGG